MDNTLYTFGKLALLVRMQEHQLDTLCRRGLVPFQRAGRLRLFNATDIPAIRSAAIAAGYLEPEVTETVPTGSPTDAVLAIA